MSTNIQLEDDINIVEHGFLVGDDADEGQLVLPAGDQESPSRQKGPAEPEDESVDLADELAAMRTQFEALQQVYNEKLSRLEEQTQRQAKPVIQEKVEDRQPTRYLTDVDLDHVQAMAKRVEMLERVASASLETSRSLEKRHFEQAWDRLKQQYDDLEDFVPKANAEYALKAINERGSFGVNWEQEIGSRYRDLAFSKHMKKSQDEITKKREEKRTTASAASKVASGGSPFQKPAENKPEKDLRYGWAKQKVLEELEALGG